MKCTAVGEFYKKEHHMSFNNFDAPKRTDASFRARLDADHHKADSPLEKIHGLDMVEDFPIADSLHLLDEGLMKRNLTAWINGTYNKRTKWRADDIKKVSDMIVGFNKFKPVELHRSFRKLDYVHYWKALEFKYFLVYLSPVVLKDYLPKDAYEHFLLAFCAVTICSSNAYTNYLDLSEQLFREYVELYVTINGEDTISSNIHNLIHIVDDVKKFGILSNLNAYAFENILMVIKNLVRSGNIPLPQVAKRLSEKSSADMVKKPIIIYPQLSNQIDFENFSSNVAIKSFAKIEISESIMLKNDEKNKWFLTQDDEIVEYLCAIHDSTENKVSLYGKSLRYITDFFDVPICSSKLNIYTSLGTQNDPQLFQLPDIKAKMFGMEYKSSLVFVPLQHTLDFFLAYE